MGRRVGGNEVTKLYFSKQYQYYENDKGEKWRRTFSHDINVPHGVWVKLDNQKGGAK